MSAGYNKIILMGNITADPVMKATKQGTPVCTFTIAVDRRRRSPEGQAVTDFFDIETWRTTAENCHRYLKKGSKVLVEGELQRYKYTKQDGTERHTLKVVADDVRFVGSRGQSESTLEEPPSAPTSYPPTSFTPVDTEELPF